MKAAVHIPKVLAVLLAQPRDLDALLRVVARLVLRQSGRRADLDQPLDVEALLAVLVVAEPVHHAAREALNVGVRPPEHGQLNGRAQCLQQALVDAEVTGAADLDVQRIVL